MRYLKDLPRRFKNGFREGEQGRLDNGQSMQMRQNALFLEGLGVPCFLAGMVFCKACCIYNIQPSGRPTCALLNVQHLAPAAAPG